MDIRAFKNEDHLPVPTPGYNAGRVSGTLGTDGYDVGSGKGQRPFVGSKHCKRFGVRPTHGADSPSGVEADEMRTLALDQAERLAKGESEKRLVEAARMMVEAERPILRLMCEALDAGTDTRKAALADLVREGVNIPRHHL